MSSQASKLNEIKITRGYDFACPACGQQQDCLSGYEVEAAKDGDLAVCLSCGSVNVLVGGGKLRELSILEWGELPAVTLEEVNRFRRYIFARNSQLQ